MCGQELGFCANQCLHGARCCAVSLSVNGTLKVDHGTHNFRYKRVQCQKKITCLSRLKHRKVSSTNVKHKVWNMSGEFMLTHVIVKFFPWLQLALRMLLPSMDMYTRVLVVLLLEILKFRGMMKDIIDVFLHVPQFRIWTTDLKCIIWEVKSRCHKIEYKYIMRHCTPHDNSVTWVLFFV